MPGKRKKPIALQVVPCINIETGGPAVSVPKLAQGIAHHGFESWMFSLDYDNLGPMNTLEDIRSFSVPTRPLNRFFRGESKRALLKLRKISKPVSVVHNHGIWMAPNRYARYAATAHDKPFVVSPRGMLSEWSLSYKSQKKLLAWHLYEKKNLEYADLFHATSQEEAEAIRRAGFSKTPIVVIPNGVDLPEKSQTIPRSFLEKDYPELKDKKWVLFLSRIHAKKGIDDLVWAWSQVAKEFSDWHLILAGPDLTGYREHVQKLVLDLEIPRSVTMTGSLTGSKRLASLCNCEVLVLPSHNENFGLVVAEALSFSKPVITTRGTPWKELENSQSGWWIEKDPENLKCTLREALTLTHKAREQMGRRGYALVQEKYTWESMAKEMARAYRWLLNQGPPPASLMH